MARGSIQIPYIILYTTSFSEHLLYFQ